MRTWNYTEKWLRPALRLNLTLRRDSTQFRNLHAANLAGCVEGGSGQAEPIVQPLRCLTY